MTRVALNYIQIEINTLRRMVQSTIGPGGLTRDQAVAVVQALLDRFPPLARVAAQWPASAEGDMVCSVRWLGRCTSTPTGRTRAALVWVHDLATAARAAGAHTSTSPHPRSRKQHRARNRCADGPARANQARLGVAEPPLHGGPHRGTSARTGQAERPLAGGATL